MDGNEAVTQTERLGSESPAERLERLAERLVALGARCGSVPAVRERCAGRPGELWPDLVLSKWDAEVAVGCLGEMRTLVSEGHKLSLRMWQEVYWGVGFVTNSILSRITGRYCKPERRPLGTWEGETFRPFLCGACGKPITVADRAEWDRYHSSGHAQCFGCQDRQWREQKEAEWRRDLEKSASRPPVSVAPRELSALELDALRWLLAAAPSSRFMQSLRRQAEAWYAEERHRFEAPLSDRQLGILVENYEKHLRSERYAEQMRRRSGPSLN